MRHPLAVLAHGTAGLVSFRSMRLIRIPLKTRMKSGGFLRKMNLIRTGINYPPSLIVCGQTQQLLKTSLALKTRIVNAE